MITWGRREAHAVGVRVTCLILRRFEDADRRLGRSGMTGGGQSATEAGGACASVAMKLLPGHCLAAPSKLPQFREIGLRGLAIVSSTRGREASRSCWCRGWETRHCCRIRLRCTLCRASGANRRTQTTWATARCRTPVGQCRVTGSVASQPTMGRSLRHDAS